MEATSPLVSLNGRNGPKDLGEYRRRAIENATKHQFYQSDRVKQFHRDLLLMETINDRRLQEERNRMITDNTNEETKKFMAEIRRGELMALERDRNQARQREATKQAYAADLRQQMREMERARQQAKLDKQRETRDCEELRRQHEREKRELRQRQHEERMGVRSVYLGQMTQRRSDRDKENRAEALEEEWRQRCVREKDEWNRANQENMADRLRRRQRRSQIVAESLAAQQRERAQEYEAADARATARALANQEERAKQERRRKWRANVEMADAIAAHREYKQRERRLRADEERRSATVTLDFNRVADATHWEREREAARTQRDARMAIDAALRQQMAEKQRRRTQRRCEEMDFDVRNEELLAHEDAQFQTYTSGVIAAAEGCKRNTVPIRKAAGKGAGQGVGPIYGGLRAKYLVPGSTYIPEYVNSTAKDISKLYGGSVYESSQGNLGFIW